MRSTLRPSQIVGATIGNALEWYDFLIFGYLTAILSRLFFPSGDVYGSQLTTFATFAVGFFMRPVGGILIGIYGDRCGRKAAMQLVIALTTVAMAIMACAPTYAAFGIGAPLIIVGVRLLQGFATGGEFASSTAFLVESSAPNRRGLAGSWQNFGQLLAMIAGTGMGAAITSTLSPAALDAWGWRIPFFAGMLIAPVGFWIRRHLDEPEIYLRANSKPRAQTPLGETLTKHRRAALACLGMIAAGTTATYIMNVYMPTFASQHLGVSLKQAFVAQMISGCMLLPLIPLFGLLSDRVGRRPVYTVSMILYTLLIYPMFSWISSNHGFTNLIIMLTVLGAARAGYAGVCSSILAEQFPTAIRSTAMSFSYNMAVMLFGGTAPFFATWLIKQTGTPMSMAVYLVIMTIVGLVSGLFIREPATLEEPVPQEKRQLQIA